MDRRRAGAVFAICVAPRLAALVVFPNAAPTYYDDLARSLLASGQLGFDGVPSTYIEPLYPAFLAAARIIAGDSLRLVILLQIVVAGIGGVLLCRLGSRLSNPRAGFYAAVFYALDPYLVRQSLALLEVTLCTTLAIAVTLQLSRVERARDAVACGALFGLLLLTRVSVMPACVAGAIWLAWEGRRRLALVMVVTTLAVQAPWLWRNARVDGSPLPSRLGENLYLSTSRYADIVPVHDIDLLIPLALAEVEPAVKNMRLAPNLEQRALDEAMLDRARAFIRERPGRVVWLKVRNALYLLSPQVLPRYMKSPDAFAAVEGGVVRTFNEQRRPLSQEVPHTVVRSALLLLAAVGLARRRLSGRDAPLLIMLGTQAAVCVAFFPTTRLMAPVMFVAMWYAAIGVTSSSAAAPRQP